MKSTFWPRYMCTSLALHSGASAQLTQQSYQGYSTGVVNNFTVAGNGTGLDSAGRLVIESDGIRASFVPYGARMTNLWVNDSNSVTRDVVLGYDTAAAYEPANTNRTFGGVQGRYPHVIANQTYQLLPGDATYSIPFGGDNVTFQEAHDEWFYRNWTIVSHTTTSVTFSLADEDPTTGFPGQTITYVTYTLSPMQCNIRIVGLSTTQYTPLMPASRIFWNLDAAADPGTPTVLNHTLRLPYSGQRIQVDPQSLAPTGLMEENQLYFIWDFWHASKSLGRNLTSRYAHNSCGTNCTGYDSTFLINRDAGLGRYDWTQTAVATLQSRFSGIRMSIFTDQAALHVDTCNTLNGSIPLKSSQGLAAAAAANETRANTVQQHGCVALTPLDWPAGIQHPGWGRQRRQQFGPLDAPYVWQAAYSFATSSATTRCATRTSVSVVRDTGVGVSTVFVTVTATATATAAIF